MTILSQDGRAGQLSTPLGKDILVLTSFDAVEGVSELFQVHVQALSEQPEVDFNQLIGKRCAIKLATPERASRYFNGFLTEARSTGRSATELSSYSFVLRPWLWLLAHRADCRIFLNKTVLQILTDVFDKAGFSQGTDYRLATSESYDEIPYCVQYRETDFTFASRLMEENGIYYFFEHSENAHTMVLADGNSSHEQNAVAPLLSCRPGYVADPKQYLFDWVTERRFSTGRYELNDYDYLKPSKRLRASKSAGNAYGYGDLEVYDYPGRYTEEKRGETLARFLLEAEQSFDQRRYADGNAPSLFPGTLVSVDRLVPASENRAYKVLRCNHRFSNEFYRPSGTVAEAEPSYRGSYEFLRSDQPFRAHPTTPRPRINGIQTAKVVGKKGENEEIVTDENGHIWVQFFWDREPQISCPVRVAQAWAGKRWGEIFIPRVGMEVIVEFLEGDPDRPLVTGCVYNGEQKTPYELPEHKTRAGWKSDSSRGHHGYNELYFEDKKGSELINVHAEKDLNTTVNNNETRNTGADLDTTIGNSETRTIGESFKVPMGSASRDTTIKMGDDKLTVETGFIQYSSPLKIELTVAGSSITIEPHAITIRAPLILLN